MHDTLTSHHRQDGAALIIVLIMMTMAVMLSVSGVQSSITNERLAGNYRAMTQAQMNAERGLTEFQDWLLDAEWASDDWKQDKNLAQQGYRIVATPEWQPGRYVTVSMEGLAGGASALATATFRKPGLPSVTADAAFTCFGNDCELVVGSANGSSANHVAASGKDFKAQCASGNDNKRPINPEGTTKAGVIMPEGSLSQQSNGNKKGNKKDNKDPGSAVDGYPAIVTEDAGYGLVAGAASQRLDSEEPAGLRQLQQELFETLMELIDSSKGNEDQSLSGEGVYYAGNGSTVSIDGNASGILILEGATLEMKGSDCFKGLIIARPSRNGDKATIAAAKGTPTLLGAIMGENFVFDGTGNPSLLYSSEALGFEESTPPGGNKPLEITDWVTGE